MGLYKLNTSFIIVIGLVGFLPSFGFPVNEFIMVSFSRELIICLLSIQLAINIPYVNIFSKCVCIAFAMTQIAQVTFVVGVYLHYVQYEYDILLYFAVVAFSLAIFLARQLVQQNKFSTDKIYNEYIYYLVPKADDFNGLISSLFYVPFSGVKVYCNGNVYAYKKGRLQKFTGKKAQFYISKCLSFNTGSLYSESIETKLDGVVGTKWTLFNNCYRTFEPMFGKLKSKLK